MSRTHHNAPRDSAMPWRNALGVQDLTDDFQSLHDARAGTIKILIAVGQIDAAGEPVHLAFGAGKVEAAWGDDEDVGIGRGELFPGHPRRVLAGFAEEIDAA